MGVWSGLCCTRLGVAWCSLFADITFAMSEVTPSAKLATTALPLAAQHSLKHFCLHDRLSLICGLGGDVSELLLRLKPS